MNYCIARNGIAYEGTLEECILQVCNIDLSDRRLKVQWLRYGNHSSWNNWHEYHSYGDSYTTQEMWNDAIQFLSERLSNYGCKLYYDQRR